MRWMILFAYFFVASCSLLSFQPLVSVEVSVINDDGTPIDDASIRGDFSGVSSGSGSVAYKSSDDKGMAIVTDRSLFPVRIIVSKDGYYPSQMDVDTTESIAGKVKYTNRKVTLVLREMRNPIPLFAKRFSGELPISERWIGFDMEKSDWTSPYGKGVISDLLFWFEGEFKSIKDGYGVLKLRVPGPGNGIQKIEKLYPDSHFKVPHSATSDEYTATEMQWIKRLGHVNDWRQRPNKGNHYFLRLRTSTKKVKHIEKSHYAKLYGDIGYSIRSIHGGVSSLEFTYYFNPNPNNRNLEFDVNRNLFKNLKHEERVWEP